MKKPQTGFTLIELLVVIAIVSILAAIAIPQFTSYKKKGFDIRALSDLRNVATAEEAYFIDNESYLSCNVASCSRLPGVGALSKGVELAMIAIDGAFTGTSTHPRGSGKIFQWDSERGGLVNQ